jgi:DNA-directed RNA polymerase subunit F
LIVTVKEWIMEKLKQRVCEDVKTLIEMYAREFNKTTPTATRTIRTKLSALARKKKVVVYKGVACLPEETEKIPAIAIQLRVARRVENLVKSITETCDEILTETLKHIIKQHKEYKKHILDLATDARLALLENNTKLAEEKLRELIEYLSVA